jgi:hypothetical protein
MYLQHQELHVIWWCFCQADDDLEEISKDQEEICFWMSQVMCSVKFLRQLLLLCNRMT